MWSLNSNSILVSDCKQLDCKLRAAHGEGSQKRKFASSNGSPRIMGFASRGCIAVCWKSDGECSRWALRLLIMWHFCSHITQVSDIVTTFIGQKSQKKHSSPLIINHWNFAKRHTAEKLFASWWNSRRTTQEMWNFASSYVNSLNM